VDVVSDDAYPDPADPLSPVYAAMQRDLMRSLGGGRPWLLMEQSPGAVNWRERNAAKLPGQMRAWSYQSIARGADGILFFQWRQAVAGAEKFHSGMVPHGGTDTRVFREVEQLGAELRSLSEADVLLGRPVHAQVAIVFDWDSWWAIEQDASPARTEYLVEVFTWYRALAGAGVTVDFVRATGDLSAYRVVVAPSLFVASDEQLSALNAFAAAGGTLVVGFLTGILDSDLHVRTGGYLGPLRETLGLRVEEFAPPAAPDLAARGGGEPPALRVRGEVVGGDCSATQWAEYVRIDEAVVEAVFADGPLDGQPAVTRHDRGAGAAWYVATRLDDAPLGALLDRVLGDASVERGPRLPGVEFVRRGDVLVAINHTGDTVALDLPGDDILTGRPGSGLRLGPQGVALLHDSRATVGPDTPLPHPA
jgi:beta-galactosidase